MSNFIIKIPIQPHFGGNYRLEYNGRHIVLWGSDRSHPGIKWHDSDPDWYEEVALVPSVFEIENASPWICKITDAEIWIDLYKGQ